MTAAEVVVVEPAERLTRTVEEAAALFGVGRRTFYDHLTDDGIQFRGEVLRTIRVGRRVLVPMVEIDRVLNGRPA